MDGAAPRPWYSMTLYTVISLNEILFTICSIFSQLFSVITSQLHVAAVLTKISIFSALYLNVRQLSLLKHF